MGAIMALRHAQRQLLEQASALWRCCRERAEASAGGAGRRAAGDGARSPARAACRGPRLRPPGASAGSHGRGREIRPQTCP